MALVREHGRLGYRKMAALLRSTSGWVVNDKRVERIWRQEGLKVPRRQPKRSSLGADHPVSTGVPLQTPCGALPAPWSGGFEPDKFTSADSSSKARCSSHKHGKRYERVRAGPRLFTAATLLSLAKAQLRSFVALNFLVSSLCI